MSSIKILLVDDDEELLKGLTEYLKRKGYYVFAMTGGRSALETMRIHKVDLVVLDIRMPGLNGLEICKKLRRNYPTLPIIFLSGLEKDIDIVKALNIGGDDYIRKPFSTIELLARIESALRRVCPSLTSQKLQFGDIEVDLKQRMVFRENIPVELTSTEFNLLHYFIRHPHTALSRDQLLDDVWGVDQYSTPRTVDYHIYQLRKKLEENPENPKHFLTVRRIGYKLSL